jgi:superfamily II DNA/RNA helicase
VLPTRELAQQVADVLGPLAQTVGLRIATVYGGAALGRQVDALQRADVVVATPGRLVDLLERRAAHLDQVEIVVLDEADHLCDLGFLPVITRLLERVPVGGQRLLFSATLDGDVDVLVRRFLVEPVLVEVDEAVSDSDDDPVVHQIVEVARREDKPGIAADLVRPAARALVFVRTKHGADRLAAQLGRAGVQAAALHGGLRQNQRTKALASFANGSMRVLVATDVAARGLHVDGVDLVLHADPPTEAKTFAHRSGRTGRAGAGGMVITLALPEERRTVLQMLQAAGVAAA